MPSPQLRIASKLLGHLLWQGPSRELPDRMEDVQHAWDVAGALLQLSYESEPLVEDGSSAPQTPVFRRSLEVRRAIVDRNALPVMPQSVEQWRASRSKKKPGAAEPERPRRPTIH